MYPTLFKIGDLSVSSYTVMLVIAYLVAYMLLISEIRRKGLSENLCDILLAAAIIGGLVGAKVLFLFQNATLSEFIRTTSPSFIPGLSQAQMISIGIIVVAAYKLIQLNIRSKKSLELQS